MTTPDTTQAGARTQVKVIESTGHGKNVKGNKRTSTIQVRSCPNGADYYLLKKQFRFTVGDPESRLSAVDKAVAYAKQLRQEVR